MTNINLLPCPFCGGKAEIERPGTARQSCIIACEDCGCRLETGEVWSMGERWNRRHPLPATEPQRSAGTDDAAYRQAIDEALVTRHLGVAKGNAQDELNAILSWEVCVALDPRVSEAAQALVDQGRAQPSAGNGDLETIYAALDQAQDCIRGETPEDVSDQEAREDTIDKVRDAMRLVEHMQAQPQRSAATEQAAGQYEFLYNRTFQAIAAATSVYAEGVGVNVSVKAFQEAFNSFPDAKPLTEPQRVQVPRPVCDCEPPLGSLCARCAYEAKHCIHGISLTTPCATCETDYGDERAYLVSRPEGK